MLISTNADILATTRKKEDYFTPSQIASAFGFHEIVEAMAVAKCGKIKLIVVGHGGVGKTALLNGIRDLQKTGRRSATQSTSTTVGIDINSQQIRFHKEVDVQIWDFAGQLEYLPYHSIFLSRSRAIYVIVIALTMSLEPQLRFWAEYIGSVVDLEDKFSTAKVLVVGSKGDLLALSALATAKESLKQ